MILGQNFSTFLGKKDQDYSENQRKNGVELAPCHGKNQWRIRLPEAFRENSKNCVED